MWWIVWDAISLIAPCELLLPAKALLSLLGSGSPFIGLSFRLPDATATAISVIPLCPDFWGAPLGAWGTRIMPYLFYCNFGYPLLYRLSGRSPWVQEGAQNLL